MVTDVKTKVIKRNGVEVSFEKEKIPNIPPNILVIGDENE